MKLQTLLIVLAFLFFSCSSEEEILTSEQKIEGSWEGAYFQAGHGNSPINIDIKTLIVNQNAASGGYGVSDLSDCDEIIYICEVENGCTFDWKFISFSGGAFEFYESINAGQESCIPGFVTLRFITDDELSYKWVGEEDSANTASGSLIRK